MKKATQKPQVEPEKLIAERINGWAAMMGFWAAVVGVRQVRTKPHFYQGSTTLRLTVESPRYNEDLSQNKSM